jgi:hypothetical protein
MGRNMKIVTPPNSPMGEEIEETSHVEEGTSRNALHFISNIGVENGAKNNCY